MRLESAAGKIKVTLLFVACVFLSVTGYAGENLYSKASTLFEHGDYAQALDIYQRLNSEKSDTAVIYNIAVCYFKMQEWDSAEEYFSQLVNEEGYADEALFSLAVIHKKQKRYTQAREAFFDLSILAEDDDLSFAAHEQYLTLSSIEAKRERKYLFVGGLSVAYGNDNNIINVTDDITTDESLPFIESIINLAIMPASTKVSGYSGNFMVYDSDYFDEDIYSIRSYVGGLDYGHMMGSSKLSGGVAFGKSNLGGSSYMNDISSHLTWRLPITKNSDLRTKMVFTSSSAQNDEYLPYEGNEITLRARYKTRLTNHHFNIEGQLGLMDKLGLQEETEQKSYSGNRGVLTGGWWYRSNHISLFTQFMIKNTRYDGTYISDGIALGNRSDNYAKASLGFEYEFNSAFTGSVEFSKSKNMSSIEEYAYEQNLYQAGISWNWER